MTSPRISVALATYNGAAFLGEQLASIAQQSLLPAELVVGDDASTDRTLAIVDEFRRAAPFPVAVHRNAQRIGSTANFGAVVARCTGTHIALCDQDDVWRPEKLERIARRFAERPDLGLVFTNAERVDEQLRPLGPDLWRLRNLPRDLLERAGSPEFAIYLLQHAVITGATMVFDARYRDLVQPVPTDLPHWIHDRWIATLIALVAPVAAIDEKLILYRQHAGQQIGAAAPARRPGANRFADNRARIRDVLASLAAIRQRLAERGAAVPRASRHYMNDLIAHLEARLALPEGRVARLPTVARETLSGRYRRFSSGLASAAKDLAL